MTIFVAVFVLEADLNSTPRRIFIVVAPAIAVPVRAIIVVMHLSIATHSTMVPILVTIHSVSHLSHVVPAHASHIVAAMLLCSPIATDPSVLGALPVLVAGLV